MTLQNAPPGLDYERDKRFSKVQIPVITVFFFLSKRGMITIYSITVFTRYSKVDLHL